MEKTTGFYGGFSDWRILKLCRRPYQWTFLQSLILIGPLISQKKIQMCTNDKDKGRCKVITIPHTWRVLKKMHNQSEVLFNCHSSVSINLMTISKSCKAAGFGSCADTTICLTYWVLVPYISRHSNIHNIYSQTCIKRSPLEQTRSDLLR